MLSSYHSYDQYNLRKWYRKIDTFVIVTKFIKLSIVTVDAQISLSYKSAPLIRQHL